MKNYLCTTGISEIWNLDSKLLLLGTWCLASKKNKQLLEDKHFDIISSPWKPSFKIKEAADYCHDIYEEVIPQVSESLNSIHQVSYPVRYWQVLLGPWLLHFIGIFYDRYKIIEKALKVSPDFYTNLLPKDQCQLVSYDTYDFLMYKAGEDFYNLKLFSLIAYDLCPNNIVVKDYKFESKINTIRHSWKRKQFYRLIKLTDIFIKSSIVLADMYHLTLADMILLELKTGLKVNCFKDFEPLEGSSLKYSYSHKLREALRRIKGDSDRFQSLLCKVLPNAIPMCYMENYRLYKNYTNRIKSKNSVRVVGSSVGWFFNEEFKFFAAEAASKEAKLIDFQHGGGYGFLLANPHERISLEKDIFYTWGWNFKKGNMSKHLPNPHLSRLKDTHLPRIDKILFVGTAVLRYHFRFHTLLLPEDMPKYFENKKIFFQALPEEIMNKVLYRPHSSDYGWEEMKIVKKECPNVKFILKGKLVNWMKKVKLVVIDHPHTGFIEALTINVPCIFYWDHKVYLMRPEVEEYFELLRKAGILYETPEKAASKLMDVFDDLWSWWNSKDVQDARNSFLAHFGYSRKNWMDYWIKEFRQLELVNIKDTEDR